MEQATRKTKPSHYDRKKLIFGSEWLWKQKEVSPEIPRGHCHLSNWRTIFWANTENSLIEKKKNVLHQTKESAQKKLDLHLLLQK